MEYVMRVKKIVPEDHKVFRGSSSLMVAMQATAYVNEIYGEMIDKEIDKHLQPASGHFADLIDKIRETIKEFRPMYVAAACKLFTEPAKQ